MTGERVEKCVKKEWGRETREFDSLDGDIDEENDDGENSDGDCSR